MAKAKKSTGSSPKSKKTTGPEKAPPAQAKPLIDTSLAAQTAARLVAARNNAAPDETKGGPGGHESASFKQFKEGLNKPTPALGGNLAPIAGQNKSSLPHTFAKQVGRNQTFGADVNRSGVPRRTGG
jgi:hypothetical protein